MEHNDIKAIYEVSFHLERISKALRIVNNSDTLCLISDYSVLNRFDIDDVVTIPRYLQDEFKQKLTDYFIEKYNEYVDKLKTIDLKEI